MNDLTLTSSVFDDGERIPDKYAYFAENVNPPFRIRNVPDGAASLALVIDDPDAKEATGKVFDHWVAWNIDPTVAEIPEGWDVDAVEGENGIGATGFLGFNPPDGEHIYKVRLYALDRELALESGSSKGDLQAAMEGHVIDEALLEGRFAPEQVPENDENADNASSH